MPVRMDMGAEYGNSVLGKGDDKYHRANERT